MRNEFDYNLLAQLVNNDNDNDSEVDDSDSEVDDNNSNDWWYTYCRKQFNSKENIFQ